jgi:hypothetical protein
VRVRLELSAAASAPADWLLEQWTVPTDAAEVFVFVGGREVARLATHDLPTRSYDPLHVRLEGPDLRAVVLVRILSSRVAWCWPRPRVLLGQGLARWGRRLLDATGATGLLLAGALASGLLSAQRGGGLVDALVLAGIAVMLGAAGLPARAGDRAAPLYLVAWSGLFLPVVMWLAEISLGGSLQMILSSLAVAERLAQARRQAEAHAAALAGLLAEQRQAADRGGAWPRAVPGRWSSARSRPHRGGGQRGPLHPPR